MSKVKILKVEQLGAYTNELRALNRRWTRFLMQVITTDKGEFIDHRAGDMGHWKGVEYVVGEDYEYECMVDNKGNEVTRDMPKASENTWLRPLLKL